MGMLKCYKILLINSEDYEVGDYVSIHSEKITIEQYVSGKCTADLLEDGEVIKFLEDNIEKFI